MRGITALLSTGYIADVPSLNTSYEQVEAAAERLNSENEDASWLLKKLLGEQEINMTADGTQLKIRMKGVGLRTFEEGQFPEPDIEVSTDERTLIEILNSEEPLGALKEKLKSGSINYSAKGTLNQVRLLFIKPLLML